MQADVILKEPPSWVPPLSLSGGARVEGGGGARPPPRTPLNEIDGNRKCNLSNFNPKYKQKQNTSEASAFLYFILLFNLIIVNIIIVLK